MTTPFRLGDWTVAPDRNSIERNGQLVGLEPRVMDLLVYFAERPGETLSVDRLIADVWPHTFITDGALLTALSTLRKALGDNARRPSYIATIPKRGYRMIAQSSARVAALAVLPIRAPADDVELSHLADGLTDALIADLGKIPALRVISTSSAMALSADERASSDAAGRLGAGLVLAASLRALDGRRLELSVHLDEPGNGQKIARLTVSRPESELLALRRDVVRDVADALQDRLRPAHSSRPIAAHPDAVIEHLRGRYHYYRQSPEHFDRALDHFERAAAIDPGYVPALVGIADVWGAYGYWGERAARDVKPRVLEPLRKAQAIDPSNADALVLEAAFHMCIDYDWDAAERLLQSAVAQSPNLCHARLIHTLLLGVRGRPQALDEADTAIRIDPLNPAVVLSRALVLGSTGNAQQALRDVAEVLALDPANRPGLQCRADLHWSLASPEALGHERAAWQADGEMSRVLSGRSSPSVCLTRAAEVLLERANERYVAPYEIARLLSLAGHIDAALESIERALAEGDFMRADFLVLSPAFRAVRRHARFGDVANRLGLPSALQTPS